MNHNAETTNSKIIDVLFTQGVAAAILLPIVIAMNIYLMFALNTEINTVTWGGASMVGNSWLIFYGIIALSVLTLVLNLIAMPILLFFQLQACILVLSIPVMVFYAICSSVTNATGDFHAMIALASLNLPLIIMHFVAQD